MNPPNHISEDDLEAYSREKPQRTARANEEHLLLCDLCRNRLDEMDAYVTAMRNFLRLIEVGSARVSLRTDFSPLAVRRRSIPFRGTGDSCLRRPTKPSG